MARPSGQAPPPRSGAPQAQGLTARARAKPVFLRAEPQPGRTLSGCSSPDFYSFTDKQGQYLAFIDAYTRVHGRPPAEADMQRHFRVSPPSVHQMVLTLERAGLIRRQPGLARSIEVLVAAECLPVLRSPQPVKTSVQRN